jgi:hypothetical protein
LNVPEIEQWGIGNRGYKIGQGNGFYRGIPESGVKEIEVNFLNQVIEEEKGNGPEKIRDDQAAKTGFQFFPEIKFFPGSVKEEISRNHGQGRRGELKHEIDQAFIHFVHDQRDTAHPVIDQDQVNYKKPYFINVL